MVRGEAGADEPRRAHAGDDGSAPRDCRVSTSTGYVELREIVVERARQWCAFVKGGRERGDIQILGRDKTLARKKRNARC